MGVKRYSHYCEMNSNFEVPDENVDHAQALAQEWIDDIKNLVRTRLQTRPDLAARQEELEALLDELNPQDLYDLAQASCALNTEIIRIPKP